MQRKSPHAGTIAPRPIAGRLQNSPHLKLTVARWCQLCLRILMHSARDMKQLTRMAARHSGRPCSLGLQDMKAHGGPTLPGQAGVIVACCRSGQHPRGITGVICRIPTGCMMALRTCAVPRASLHRRLSGTRLLWAVQEIGAGSPKTGRPCVMHASAMISPNSHARFPYARFNLEVSDVLLMFSLC